MPLADTFFGAVRLAGVLSMQQEVFENLGIAVLLGMLVGLQRERVAEPLAGLRTFPLITVMGVLAALIDQQIGTGGWLVVGGLVAVSAMAITSNLQRVGNDRQELGTTTEIAILVMYLVGSYLVVGDRVVAIAIGVGCAVLLEFKPELHGIVARLQDRDVRAFMQFALVTFVVLPILPNKSYGPENLRVLNPREVWLMVVLITGIGLAGYVLYKLFGQTLGTVLGGILGGAISSTATTVSYSRRTTAGEVPDSLAATVVCIAAAMVYVRVLIEVGVVAPSFLTKVAGPVGCLLVAGIFAALAAWFYGRSQREPPPDFKNPSELKTALAFGAMYALVLFALAAGREYFGGQGMFLVAGISGLTDMDAITLSTSRLVANGDGAGLDPSTGWRLIVVALLSNLVFKVGMIGFLGSRRMFVFVAQLLGLQIAAALALLMLWPL